MLAEGNELVAQGNVELIVASAAKHPYPLVTGYYSVHISQTALAEGERTLPHWSVVPSSPRCATPDLVH